MTGTGFKALLVAAGVGSRLKPLTDVLPKCLMPVAGRPLLGLWLRMLREAGGARIVVNLHHHADLVRAFIENSPYNPLVTTAYEERLLGTGGTLLRNRKTLEGGPLLFAHADNLTHFDVAAFLAAHARRPAGAVMTMMTFTTDDPQSCGIVELNRAGVVTAFHEKVENPPGNTANAAVYVLEPEVFDAVEAVEKPEIDFSTDIVPRFIGRIFAVRNDSYHRDIGSLPSLLKAQIEYPLIAGTGDAADDDPWYGLMRADNGRLAAEFRAALGKAFPA